MSRRPPALPAIALSLLLASTAGAWTLSTHTEIARQAIRVAPPDLSGQIQRHSRELLRGLDEALREASAEAAEPGPLLAARVQEEGAEAIASIARHHPFRELTYRLGGLAFSVSLANDPTYPGSGSGVPVAPWYRDWNLYVESASSRFAVVFYPGGRAPSSMDGLGQLVAEAQLRSRRFRPLVAAEYARIGGSGGRERFDDRSTAFGVASVSFSQAVSDVAAMLRYVWVRAGGADRPGLRLLEADRLLMLSRGARAP